VLCHYGTSFTVRVNGCNHLHRFTTLLKGQD
jgi:hypothetical protein